MNGGGDHIVTVGSDKWTVKIHQQGRWGDQVNGGMEGVEDLIGVVDLQMSTMDKTR